MKKICCWFGFALCLASSAFAETILVHAGELLAVPGESSVRERTLVIRTFIMRDGLVFKHGLDE